MFESDSAPQAVSESSTIALSLNVPAAKHPSSSASSSVELESKQPAPVGGTHSRVPSSSSIPEFVRSTTSRHVGGDTRFIFREIFTSAAAPCDLSILVFLKLFSHDQPFSTFLVLTKSSPADFFFSSVFSLPQSGHSRRRWRQQQWRRWRRQRQR